MTDRIRLWLAWRTARRLVATRRALSPVAAAGVHRVLVLLPDDPDALRSAWRTVAAIDAPVVPVATERTLTDIPDAFIGRVVRLGPNLLAREALSDLWRDVDVALAFEPLATPAAVALIAACPAALRVGVDGDGLDLAVPTATADVPARLLDVLRQVRPARLPLR